jgi:hypothetical protein
MKKKTALSHPAFFNRYVEMVDDVSILNALSESLNNLQADMDVIANLDFDYSYSENKWTIKTLIRHCIDAEIIFLSRALAIARSDDNPIRSFDENEYANASIADYNKNDLIEEFLNINSSSPSSIPS